MELAAGAFRDLCEAGEVPPISAYAALISGYAGCGDVEVAVDLLGAVRTAIAEEGGGPLDEELCNEVLQGCARHRSWQAGERALGEMEESGAVPSEATLRALLELYAGC